MKKIFIRNILPVFFLVFYACQPAVKKNAPVPGSAEVVQGKIIFDTHCSGCHGFLQDGIGPSLSGVTTVDSTDWLKSFVRSPKKMLTAGDSRTQRLMSVYHTLMPSFENLNEDELNELISFLSTQHDSATRTTRAGSIEDPFPKKITASTIQLNLQLLATVPASSLQEPRTRICQMTYVKPEKAWFILDQRGVLYSMHDSTPVPWLDISKWKRDFIREPGLATGFGSFAFHPRFADNGLFYTTHCEKPHAALADFPLPDSIPSVLQWVLTEWKVNPASAEIFSGSQRELLRIDMVSGIHGLQEIAFNNRVLVGDPDFGMLYIGVGDGGSVEHGYAFLTHHPDRIWGTILRIDPQGRNSRNGRYGIPAGNPFVKARIPAAAEIFAMGFRNPNRFCWTTKNELLVTNIGQTHVESIDLVAKGDNYGWPFREGPFSMQPGPDLNAIYPLPSNDSNFHYSYPVAAFDHDEGKAIQGGFVYEGKAIPSLQGKYLFGDIPTGRLFFCDVNALKKGKLAAIKEWFISINGKRTSLRTLGAQDRVDLRFAQDEKGEIVIFTKATGKIYRLVR